MNNYLSFYACGALIFALGLIEVVSADGPSPYSVISADLGGQHYGPGHVIFPVGITAPGPHRFAYAEKVGVGAAAQFHIRAEYHVEKVSYFEPSDENNSIEFRYDDGTTNILSFFDAGERAALERKLLEENITKKTDDAKPSD